MSLKRLTVKQLLIRHDIEMMIIALLLLVMVAVLYWSLLRVTTPVEVSFTVEPQKAGHAWVNGRQIW